MSRMDFDSLFHDRRPPLPEPETRPEVEEAPEVEHGTEVDPRMTEDALLDSIRVPSAHPGPGAIVLPRVRDRDLCAVCFEALASHGSVHRRDWHAPEPMERVTPGVHPQADRGAAQQAYANELRRSRRG